MRVYQDWFNFVRWYRPIVYIKNEQLKFLFVYIYKYVNLFIYYINFTSSLNNVKKFLLYSSGKIFFVIRKSKKKTKKKSKKERLTLDLNL